MILVLVVGKFLARNVSFPFPRAVSSHAETWLCKFVVEFSFVHTTGMFFVGELVWGAVPPKSMDTMTEFRRDLRLLTEQFISDFQQVFAMTIEPSERNRAQKMAPPHPSLVDFHQLRMFSVRQLQVVQVVVPPGVSADQIQVLLVHVGKCSSSECLSIRHVSVWSLVSSFV